MSRQEQAERSCIGHKSDNSLGIARGARDCDIYLCIQNMWYLCIQNIRKMKIKF